MPLSDRRKLKSNPQKRLLEAKTKWREISLDLILVSSYWIEALILVMMNLPLLILFLFPEKFMRGDFYRLIGDAVFLLPLPYLLVNG